MSHGVDYGFDQLQLAFLPRFGRSEAMLLMNSAAIAWPSATGETRQGDALLP